MGWRKKADEADASRDRASGSRASAAGADAADDSASKTGSSSASDSPAKAESTAGYAPYPLKSFFSWRGFWSLLARFFWIFVICSGLGLAVEEAYHLAVYGEWENREGMLFGPFSPLYGLGAVIIVMTGDLLRRMPWPIAFLGFMVAGAATEYVASILLESLFGIVSWNYVNAEYTLDGRVNLAYTVVWGFLGLLCNRVLMPVFDRRAMPLIDCIPIWVSVILYVLFTADIVMTLLSFDCWFWRLEGQEPTGPIQTFYAEYFGNEFMTERFETMSIDPEWAWR